MEDSKPQGDFALLLPYLTSEAHGQSRALDEALAVLRTLPASTRPRILDLGCGVGQSFDELTAERDVQWIGVEIPDSPEASAGIRKGAPVSFFDGVNIPIATANVDLVYSRQVFEHVRHPLPLLREVARILRPGGVFVGSTSHLEPFHSRSYWNFTPYGFAKMLEEAGFADVSLRPGVDAFSLMTRRLLSWIRVDLDARRLEKRSPFNVALDIASRLGKLQPQRTLALKLLFSGHFTFRATVPAG